MVTNTLVASPEAQRGAVVLKRSDSFLVDNLPGNDLPKLLRRAGVKDCGRFTSWWKPLRRSSPGPYGLEEYRFAALPDGSTFSTKEMLVHFKCRFFHPHATTYELLGAVSEAASMAPHHLSEGRKLVALGRDQFNCTPDGTFSMIEALDGQRRLHRSSNILGQVWDSSFMFLMRVS